MKRIQGLDTLRFFAFFSIFLFHSTSNFSYGYLGVDFFFVLSSFLLSYLAFNEIESSGSFSMQNFFIRRSLRIFPLYYLVIIGSFIFAPFLYRYLAIDAQLPDNQLLYWFFLSNYESSDSLFYLKFLWSIAVEEQFYLLFIGLSFLLRGKVYLFISILMLCYSIFIYYASQNEISIYSNTINHFPNFSAGILGAYLYFKNPKISWQIVAGFILSVILITVSNHFIVSKIFTSLFFLSSILLFISISEYLKKLFIFRLTEKLGNYTYGMYIYSGIVLTLLPKFITFEHLIFKLITEFILILAIAMLSYHFYEKYFLAFKKFFRQNKH